MFLKTYIHLSLCMTLEPGCFIVMPLSNTLPYIFAPTENACMMLLINQSLGCSPALSLR